MMSSEIKLFFLFNINTFNLFLLPNYPCKCLQWTPVLNRNDENVFLCLIPHLRKKIMSLTIKYNVICGFNIDSLHQDEEISFHY